MDVQFKEILRLQQVDGQVAELLDAIAATPKRVASLEEKLERHKQTLAQAEKAALAEEAKRRRLESDLRDQQQKIVKYREQSSIVKTNEQFHALQHEVSFVEAEIQRIEDAELASMIESETLDARRTEARQELAAQAKQIELEKETLKRDSEAKQQDVETLRKERELIRSTVDPALLSEYDRLTSSRKNALARASNQRCMACQMYLRPQFWNQVRAGTLSHCESCGRLLYFDPSLEPTPDTEGIPQK
jgi:predicted  nucleic acid-binding Zn-ribbon protein